MVYLDNAATTFPKPSEVSGEVCRCMREYGGNPGRGAHPIAMAAAEKVYECRERLSDFFGAPGAGSVIMTPGATFALNLAIKGLIPPGDRARGERMHIIISDLEHNSVRRPAERLRRDGLADISVFRTEAARGGARPGETTRAVARLINRRTRAVICTAASNVCSVRLPLAEIGALCRRRGLVFIVDGAQGAGHFPINMKEQSIDALALPGHKGLYGPQGSGALILGGDICRRRLSRAAAGRCRLTRKCLPIRPKNMRREHLTFLQRRGFVPGLNLSEGSASTPCGGMRKHFSTMPSGGAADCAV